MTYNFGLEHMNDSITVVCSIPKKTLLFGSAAVYENASNVPKAFF